ncbi:MAG: spore maturation protein [Clostridia bacterium]
MSAYLIPLLAVAVLIVGLIRRVDVYEAFAEGAAEGLPVLLKILPYLATMLIAVRMLRESGLMDDLVRLLTPACDWLDVDAALLPLIVIRPFSGSGSMALLKELLAQYGPDSRIGLTASVLMGSSETIFYEVALYFGVIGMKRTRFAIPVALVAGAVSVVASILLARLL